MAEQQREEATSTMTSPKPAVVDMPSVARIPTFRQMGGSLGVAVFGAVVNATGHFASGLRIDFAAIAVLLAITALLSLTLRGVRGVRQ